MLGDEGLRIFTYEDKLVIAGGEKRGALYGVFTFLEEALGCRWFAADLTVVPELDIVSVRKDIDIEQIPCSTTRCILELRRARISAWRTDKRHSIPWPFRQMAEAESNTAVHFVHIHFLVPPSVYFDEHPKYYAPSKRHKRDNSACHKSRCFKDCHRNSSELAEPTPPLM